jgi:hypothetical protein
MRYGAHLKERTFVAKLSHDAIACFHRDAPLDAGGRPASNCTESQIVVRNRTALPQKHRNDSRHELDIGCLIDRDPGARMDCRKTNTSSGNRRKSIAAYRIVDGSHACPVQFLRSLAEVKCVRDNPEHMEFKNFRSWLDARLEVDR